MKWTPRQDRLEKLYDKGEYKIVKRFLFFPKKIGTERRWLETVYIKREINHEYYDTFEYSYQSTKWMSKEDYLNKYPHKIKTTSGFIEIPTIYIEENKDNIKLQ